MLFEYLNGKCLVAHTRTLKKGNKSHAQIHAEELSVPPSEFHSSTELEEWDHALNTATDLPNGSIKSKTEHEFPIMRERVTHRATYALFS